jgi:hypothetical protein
MSQQEAPVGSYPALGAKRRPLRTPWWIWLALLLLVILVVLAVVVAVVGLDDDVDAPTTRGAPLLATVLG